MSGTAPGYLSGANIRFGCDTPDPTHPYTTYEWGTDKMDGCGASVELDLGAFGAGQSKSFSFYYGVTPDAATAMEAINLVGVQVYSLAKPPGGPLNGTPATGVLAFDGSGLA
jgi:hypothetical protein